MVYRLHFHLYVCAVVQKDSVNCIYERIVPRPFSTGKVLISLRDLGHTLIWMRGTLLWEAAPGIIEVDKSHDKPSVS